MNFNDNDSHADSTSSTGDDSGKLPHDDGNIAESMTADDRTDAARRSTMTETAKLPPSQVTIPHVEEPPGHLVYNIHGETAFKWLEDSLHMDMLFWEHLNIVYQLLFFFSQSISKVLLITCPSTYPMVPIDQKIKNRWYIEYIGRREVDQFRKSHDTVQPDVKLSELLQNIDTQDKLVILCCERAWELGHALVTKAKVGNVICCRLDPDSYANEIYGNDNNELQRFDEANRVFLKVFPQNLSDLKPETIKKAFDLAVNSAIREFYARTGRILPTSKFIKLPAEELNFNFSEDDQEKNNEAADNDMETDQEDTPRGVEMDKEFVKFVLISNKDIPKSEK